MGRIMRCREKVSLRRWAAIWSFAVAMGFWGVAVGAQQVPQRIVSLSPNITEILFALGLERQIVGVTDFCKYPAEAQGKAKVGNLLSPNLEAIIALKPDLIIMLPSYETTRKKLESLGIRTLELKNDTIRDVLDSIGVIGAATGKSAEGKKLAEGMKAELGRIGREVAGQARVRVLFVADHNPGTLQQIYAAGPGTFADDMITAAGGENVLKHSLGRYPIVSKEEIIALNPEVILDASYLGGDSGVIAARKEGWQKQEAELWGQLPSVSAVKHGRVVVLDDPALTIPGAKIAEHVDYLKRLFHPGVVTPTGTAATKGIL
jgi:iron complex transport system substrate-binding protein